MRHRTSLTKQTGDAVQSDVCLLDDAFLPAQAAHTRTSNNQSALMPLPPHSDIETPTAMWGVVYAYLALLASLGFLFVLATTGGLNLG